MNSSMPIFIQLNDVMIQRNAVAGWSLQYIPKDNVNPEYFVLFIYRHDIETPIMITYTTSEARDLDVEALYKAFDLEMV